MTKMLIIGLLAIAAQSLLPHAALAATPKSALIAVSVTVLPVCSVSIEQPKVAVTCSHRDIHYSVSEMANSAGTAFNPPMIAKTSDQNVTVTVVTY